MRSPQASAEASGDRAKSRASARLGLPGLLRGRDPPADRRAVVGHEERDVAGEAFPQLRIEDESAIGPTPQLAGVVFDLIDANAKPFIVGGDSTGLTAVRTAEREPGQQNAEAARIAGSERRGRERVRHKPHILCARREQECRRTVLDERTHDLAVGHQMQFGVARLRPTDLFGTRGESLADEVEYRALVDHGAAEIGMAALASLQDGGKEAAQLLEGA